MAKVDNDGVDDERHPAAVFLRGSEDDDTAAFVMGPPPTTTTTTAAAEDDGDGPTDPESSSSFAAAVNGHPMTTTHHHHNVPPPPPTQPANLRQTTAMMMTTHTAVDPSILLERQCACKVVMGEIHTVWVLMRADARYANPNRFVAEEEDDDHDDHLGGGGGGSSSSSLIAELQALKEQLWHHNSMERPLPLIAILSPFCSAIANRHISAAVTGASLSALHKFLLYGFMTNRQVVAAATTTATAQDDPPNNNNNNKRKKKKKNKFAGMEGMTLIAKSLLHCTFEESTHGPSSSTITASLSNTNNHHNHSHSSSSSRRNLSRQSSLISGLSSSASLVHAQQQHTWHDDEQVVLKLLSLATFLVQSALSTSRTTTTSKEAVPSAAAAATTATTTTDGHPESEIMPTTTTTMDGTNEGDNVVLLESISHDGQPTSSNDDDCDDDDDEDDLDGRLLDATLLVGLLDTCLHVSHRAKDASPLLQSAATDASGQIVLHIFRTHGRTRHQQQVLSQARATILSQLASLVNPISSTDATCVTSLSLVNIALETMAVKGGGGGHHRHYNRSVGGSGNDDSAGGGVSAHESSILQNDLAKHLLQWSTTHDLVILSLVLRVIFNLFSLLRNQMKVPLEIFLTSVHLRILGEARNHHNNNKSTNTVLSSSSSKSSTSPITNEQREVALESLLEFCQEPALMQDLYLNYDCDVHCSNLMELLMNALAHTASPGGGNNDAVTALNRLALEGILSVVESIAKKCKTSNKAGSRDYFTMSHHGAAAAGGGGGEDDVVSDLSEELSESDTATWTTQETTTPNHHATTTTTGSGMMGADDLGARWQAEEAHKLAQERKRQKHLLAQVASVFNKGIRNDWISTGLGLELFVPAAGGDPPEGDELAMPEPKALAQFLFSTPHLDKVQMGLWLSKGPKDQYPLNAQVLEEFTKLYDFRDMDSSFSPALRKFLGKFRLPGEAQCIDRLMEAFSSELYRQAQEEKKTTKTTKESGTQSDGEHHDNCTEDNKLPFKSADAVFAMAFSTIMLNTDLHNPGVKDDKRMTMADFVKNNRGLNDGEDFPVEFLESLYKEIQVNELMVQKEFMELIRRHQEDAETLPAKHWEGILSRAHEPAYFTTPAEAAAGRIMEANVHDRDMFVVMSKPIVKAVSDVFVKSINDSLVVKALVGFQHMAKICVYFDLDDTFNDILQILLGHGRDYIMSCIALEYAGYEGGQVLPGDSEGNTQTTATSTPAPPVVVASAPDSANAPIPKEFLVKTPAWSEATDIVGSAAHRGLLALDCAFTLIRTQPDRIREAWPTLIECLCALRDARALPDRVIFLDDFADSRGNLLPLSPFAKQSQRRLDEYYRSLSSDRDKGKGWFSGLFGGGGQKKDTHENSAGDLIFSGDVSGDGDALDDAIVEKELSSFSRSLLHVTKRAKLEQVVLMRPKNLPLAKQTIRALLDAIDVYPYFEDPIFEQHAVYSLELALLALISNRDRVVDLYPMFLEKFDTVLQGGRKREGGNTNDSSGPDTERHLPTPFLMERVVVTILRSCIHLYDVPEIRAQLRTSLHLLMSLPSSFTRYVADRTACGMAIFLSQKFHLLTNSNDWSFITDMLNSLAFYGSARGFVFDGIANTVESQLVGEDVPERVLSAAGSIMLTKLLLKFVFGTYQNDLSLSIPAMMCLENLYRHTVQLHYLEEQMRKGIDNAEPLDLSDDATIVVPDEDAWQNIAVAFYSVCRNVDANTSRQGTDCFQRFVASTKMDSVSDEKWILLLVLIVNKQPSVTAEETRVNCCTILCKVLLMTIAHLSANADNHEDLTEVINSMALLVGANLREGRRGSVSPLFESTLQSVTFLCNHLVSNEYTGNKEYGLWVSDTLLAELEKFGAAGAAHRNLAATTKNKPSSSSSSRLVDPAMSSSARSMQSTTESMTSSSRSFSKETSASAVNGDGTTGSG